MTADGGHFCFNADNNIRQVDKYVTNVIHICHKNS